jgi:hypothetical protein
VGHLGLVGGLEFCEGDRLLVCEEGELGLDLPHELVRRLLRRTVLLLDALKEEVLAILVVEETPDNLAAWLYEGEALD